MRLLMDKPFERRFVPEICDPVVSPGRSAETGAGNEIYHTVIGLHGDLVSTPGLYFAQNGCIHLSARCLSGDKQRRA